MSKLWAGIVSVFSLLIGLFFLEREKKLNAEAQLQNSKVNEQDAVLNQHTADVQTQINKDNAQATADKAAPATNDELLNFLNKKDS